MKVILLVIDTLRADHLGCYGYHRNTSPNIDRLAKEGVVFENAYPTDVPTQPSFTSIFTGERGIQTGIVSHSQTEKLSEQTSCFPELLSQKGITTVAVSTLYMMRRWFARGYKYYMNPISGIRNRLQQIDAEEINSFALPWIKEHYKEDFFMFMHYWDPHMLYLPPYPYRQLFYKGNESDPANHSLDILKSQPIWPFVKRHLDSIGNDITDKEYVIAQYDSEIRYADEKVKELLDLIDKLCISNDTTIILTSDHGESMGEHNFYFDHHGVYETTIHVPLIIRNPQYNFQEMRVNDLVQSSICLRPTIVSLFGMQDQNNLEGKNLIRIAGEEDKGTEEIYSNMGVWTAKRAFRKGRWKIIKTLDKSFWETPDIELFDVLNDPQETHDVANDHSSLVDELELRMERWLKDQIGKKIDPLELIVNYGLPVYYWVETAAEQTGLSKSYEEWRMRVDKGEIT